MPEEAPLRLLQPEDVLRVLHGFNPWWTSRTVSIPPFHRLAFDACSRYLFDESIRRGVLISGPRRVGKTTVLYQLAQTLLARKVAPQAILYLSLDHPVLKLLRIDQILAEYHAQVHPEGEPAVFLLDEVQYSRD